MIKIGDINTSLQRIGVAIGIIDENFRNHVPEWRNFGVLPAESGIRSAPISQRGNLAADLHNHECLRLRCLFPTATPEKFLELILCVGGLGDRDADRELGVIPNSVSMRVHCCQAMFAT